MNVKRKIVFCFLFTVAIMRCQSTQLKDLIRIDVCSPPQNASALAEHVDQVIDEMMDVTPDKLILELEQKSDWWRAEKRVTSGYILGVKTLKRDGLVDVQCPVQSHEPAVLKLTLSSKSMTAIHNWRTQLLLAFMGEAIVKMREFATDLKVMYDRLMVDPPEVISLEITRLTISEVVNSGNFSSFLNYFNNVSANRFQETIKFKIQTTLKMYLNKLIKKLYT